MIDDSLLPFSLPSVDRRKITAAFDGGRISSDGGAMLLGLAERSQLSVPSERASMHLWWCLTCAKRGPMTEHIEHFRLKSGLRNGKSRGMRGNP